MIARIKKNSEFETCFKLSTALRVRYNEVAKNVSVSSASEVGVGTRVLFPQGQYRLTTADNKATDKSTISGYR